jgi:hypothetical protein
MTVFPVIARLGLVDVVSLNDTITRRRIGYGTLLGDACASPWCEDRKRDDQPDRPSHHEDNGNHWNRDATHSCVHGEGQDGADRDEKHRNADANYLPPRNGPTS